VHCELILPAGLEPGARLPALELLLARARRVYCDARGALAWLAEACGLESLPAGALTALEPGFWVRADPVHFELLRDSVRILPAAGLDDARAAALIETLNRHFAGRHEFRAPRPDAWAMRCEPHSLEAPPTAEVAGRDLRECLPASPWPALLNEIQMALHEHPANEGFEREANGVWLWGAGELPPSAAAPWRSLAARDPAALGLARVAGIAAHAPAADARQWLESLPDEGRHLAMPQDDAEALEARWFAPLLEALRAERVGMLTLHAPESGVSFEIVRGDLRRFWRRARPLAAYAPR
jgi:hypothetical protein